MPDSIAQIWDARSLRETVDLFQGAGADSEITSEVRFLRASARLLNKRRSRSESSNDPERLAVILLTTPKKGDPFLQPFSLEPMLDQGVVPLNGRLWLTNEGANFGHYLDHDLAGADIFSWVVDELGLGDTTAIVFDPNVDGGELRYYVDGLSDLAKVRSYPIAYIDPVTYDDARRVIDLVYSEALASPQHQVNHVSTWRKAASYWANDNAEGVIQSHIRVALKFAFLFCEVSKEGPIASGRFDLTITHLDQATRATNCYGVIELKVLKTFGSTGNVYSDSDNRTAVADGLLQAHSYRDDIPAAWAALCCFDMRREDDPSESCFDQIKDEASEKNVELGRWRLFASAKSFREARAS